MRQCVYLINIHLLQQTQEYRINDHNLSSKSVVKYLGVFINSHLKWSDHIKHVTAKATSVLRHFLYTCLSSVKAAVYKCIVRPILEYASPVWYQVHLVTLNSWKVFSAEQPDGFVEVGGILSIDNGPNHLTVV